MDRTSEISFTSSKFRLSFRLVRMGFLEFGLFPSVRLQFLRVLFPRISVGFLGFGWVPKGFGAFHEDLVGLDRNKNLETAGFLKLLFIWYKNHALSAGNLCVRTRKN